MKYILPVILGMGALVGAVATAIANANGMLTGRVHLVPWLYVICGLFFATGLAMAFGISKKEQEEESKEENITDKAESPQHQQAATPAPVESAPKKPKTNIRYIETRSGYVSEWSGILNETSRTGDAPAIIVCFRNDATEEELDHPNVIAHIIFRDSNGDEITDASPGVWIGPHRASAEFTCGDKRCMVVFLLGSEGALFKIWNEKITARAAGRPRSLFDLAHDSIAETVTTVEINLLASWSRVRLFQAVFDLESYKNGQLPTLKLRVTSTGQLSSRVLS